jgi:hypothetical protein
MYFDENSRVGSAPALAGVPIFTNAIVTAVADFTTVHGIPRCSLASIIRYLQAFVIVSAV